MIRTANAHLHGQVEGAVREAYKDAEKHLVHLYRYQGSRNITNCVVRHKVRLRIEQSL
jgi:hypothetical protein